MKNIKARFNAAYSQFQSQAVLSYRNTYLILSLVVLVVLVIRLFTISTPSLEWASWKEIDYLTISKNYWQNGFNFLKPEVTWPAEPPRVTEMELPLVPFLTAVSYQLFGYGAFAARPRLPDRAFAPHRAALASAPRAPIHSSTTESQHA